MKTFKGDTSSGRPDAKTMEKLEELVRARFKSFVKGKDSWRKRDAAQVCCGNRFELLALDKIWFAVNARAGARWHAAAHCWIVPAIEKGTGKKGTAK